MKSNESNQRIEKILDEWDPIGILQHVKPIIYHDDNRSIGEYSKYVKPIIRIFLENKSVYEYLIILHTDLRDDPNEQIMDEIKLVAERIEAVLSSCDLNEIKESCKNDH